MHASIALSALFAAAAIAKPIHGAHRQLHEKRDYGVYTHIDYVYATQVVTKYVGGDYTPTPEPTPAQYTVIESSPPAPEYTPSSKAPAPVYSKPAPSSSSPAPASYTPGGSYPSSDYQGLVIAHHNAHRANHSAAPVEWDAELAAIALSEAEVCIYAHNVTGGGGGYGQNIAAGVSPDNIGDVITGLFYNGEEPKYEGQYGLANPDMSIFEEIGHFTQVVWKATTHVGCATADCSGNGLGGLSGGGISPYFTVCNYRTEGNFGGEYGTNVGEPLGHAPIDGTAFLSS